MSTPRHRPVLVVDYGAQYAQLIARRIREAQVYSEVVPHTTPVDEILARDPAAIVLSGGPASVYADGAPAVDPALFEAGVPVLGICYGFQLMAQALGGEVARTGGGEYGHAVADRRMSAPAGAAGAAGAVPATSVLLDGDPPHQPVWMSHGDAVVREPAGFTVVAVSPGAAVAAFEDRARRLYGVQWHPEVSHTVHGQALLTRFLRHGAGIVPDWTPGDVVDELVADARARIGDGHAICGLSGGVDSAVAAAVVHRAIGDRLTCVFVDHGLLRAGEAEQVERDFVAATGVRLVVVDAAQRFLTALEGVADPEEKRKIIGREFIRVFEEAAADAVAHEADRPSGSADPGPQFLVQGTLYPDVVESGGTGGTATIKTHHNVGGLPDDLTFQLVEPLRLLFKDEVRQLGRVLGLPEPIVTRHPFPGPGLAIRIVGDVTAPRLETLRAADAVVRDELATAGLEAELWQVPVVLLPGVRSVGVAGDGRTYGHPVVLRPVTSEDAMTADWARLPYDVLARISTRITNEVPGITRVVLDITSKPPGTIEWE